MKQSHSVPSGGGGNLNRAKGSVKVSVKGKLFLAISALKANKTFDDVPSSGNSHAAYV